MSDPTDEEPGSLHISMLEFAQESEDEQYQEAELVLIEATAYDLRLLGEMFIAAANASAIDCHRHISPRGVGKDFFVDRTSFGLYLHRLPCPDGVGRK